MHRRAAEKNALASRGKRCRPGSRRSEVAQDGTLSLGATFQVARRFAPPDAWRRQGRNGVST